MYFGKQKAVLTFPFYKNVLISKMERGTSLFLFYKKQKAKR